MPLRSINVQPKLPSASACSASPVEATARHWYPRPLRKPRSPGCVAGSTSTTRALCSIMFGDMWLVESRWSLWANGVPDVHSESRELYVTDLSHKFDWRSHWRGTSRRAEVGSLGPTVKFVTLSGIQ